MSLNWRFRRCAIAKRKWRRPNIIASWRSCCCKSRGFTKKVRRRSSDVVPGSIVFGGRGGGSSADYFSSDPAHGEGSRSFVDADVFEGEPAAAHEAESSRKHSFAADALRGDLPAGI